MQGVAGFGLASMPNLQAMLYDPTQPVGARISILNTTIVARLYHSEATVSAARFSLPSYSTHSRRSCYTTAAS